MRSPFSKKKADPVKDARSHLHRLKEKLEEVTKAVDNSDQSIQLLLADDTDDAALTVAEEKHRALEDRREHLVDAIILAERRLAAAEGEQAEADEDKVREGTGNEITQIKSRLRTVDDQYLQIMSAMVDASLAAAAFVPEANVLHIYATRAIVEVRDLMQTIIQRAEDHRQAVLTRAAPATIRRGDEPAQTLSPPVPTVARKRVFAVRAIRFTNDAGIIEFFGKNRDVDLPTEVAARALELRAVVELTDPHRKKLHTQYVHNVDPRWCLDLDPPGPDAETKASVGHDNVFIRVDRGQPYTVKAN